ncbi:MAG: MMPL family transporter [Deltaproteobacteria bacterium]|nr:MMPL family transporter [Deltaproteobacteria bacterium]
MTNLLKKISSFVFRFHQAILVSSIILTILTTALIFRIDIKTDILDALPAKNPAIDTFVNFLNDFGSMDNLIVVLKSKDKKVDEYFELTESLSRRLKDSPLIEYVDYNIVQLDKEMMIKNFSLYMDKHALEELKTRLTKQGIERQIKQNKNQLLSPVSTPLDSELIVRDPLNIRSIMLSSLFRQGMDKINIKHGYYISNNNSMLIIFVKPAGSSRDIGFVKRFKNEIDHILEDTKKQMGKNHDLQLGLAGPYAFAIEAHATIQKDVIINAITSTLLVFFLFQFVYRKRVFVLIIAALTLLTALSWTLGIAYLIFGNLNMASSIVTAMLMGLGIDYIIHIFNRCEEEYIKTGDLRCSLYTALTKTAPGVVAGAVTTSAAFFSIVVTSFKGLYQLGIIAGIGVLACLFSSLIIMTSLIIAIESRKKGLLFSSKEQRIGMEGIGKIVKDYPRAVILVSIALLAISLIGLSGIKFDNRPEAVGPKTSHAMLLEKEIAEHFGRQKNPLMIIIEAENKEGLMDRYDKLETLIGKWQSAGIISSHSGLNMFLPPLSKQMEAIFVLKEIRDSIDPDRMEKIFIQALQENGFVVAEQYAAYIKGIGNAIDIKQPLGLKTLEDSNDKKIRYFYNKDRLKIAAYLYQDSEQWSEAKTTLIEKELEGLGKGFNITGTSIMFANLKTSIIRESVAASTIAFIIIFFIIYFQFKSIKRVFLVKIPLATGFILTLGFMGFTGIQFNYINIGAITLLFGIGVDYGIYILQDYIEEERKNAEDSVKHAGKTVVMCAMTTIAGFGSLVTTGFRGIATLGAIITIGVIACLLCALFLLPALMHYIEE